MTAPERHNPLLKLHQEIDERVAEVEGRLPRALNCKLSCHDCCVDDLTVFGIEADIIREHYPKLLASAAPHAPGACAFLDNEGACRIYEHRPYVCRTQGLPLSWQSTDDVGAEVELRDICPINEEPLGQVLTQLAPEQCWQLGEFEGRLASLQAETQGGFELAREALREMFAKSGV